MTGKIRPLVAISCAVSMLVLAIALGASSDPGQAENVDWYLDWQAWAIMTVLAAGVTWASGAIKRPSTSAVTTSLLFIPAYWAYIVTADLSGNGSLLGGTDEGLPQDAVTLAFVFLSSAAVGVVIGGVYGLVAHWVYSSFVWIADQVRHPARA